MKTQTDKATTVAAQGQNVRDAVNELVKDGGYDVRDGIIRSLGKFEGEHIMTLYFYDAFMNGDGEQYEGNDLAFDVSDDEAEAFDLAKGSQVILCFSEQGFVSTYVNNTPVEPEPEPCAEDYTIIKTSSSPFDNAAQEGFPNPNKATSD